MSVQEVGATSTIGVYVSEGRRSISMRRKADVVSMKKVPVSPLIPILWVFGSLVAAVSLGFAVASGFRECQDSAMCSMSSAIEMLFSVMGVFVGALIIVGGFALRSAHERKHEEDKYREDMRSMINSIRADGNE